MFRSRRPSVISGLLTLFLLRCSGFAQNTIHVPGDQTTIQGAINAANNGDTVLVAPGTYYENINFMGKAITVTSSGGAAGTVIDGGHHAPVVIFNTGEGPNSVLNAFTLQNGTSTFATQYGGGGIYISSASPRVTNNLIQNNTACDHGAGIAINGGSPAIYTNTIQNNYQAGCYGGPGGAGVGIVGVGSARIDGNLILSNTWGEGNGGGITLFGAGTPIIRNNTIAQNVVAGASALAQGGGIWSVSSDALIVQNLIFANKANLGTGIYVNVQSGDIGPVIVNNTIVGGTGSPLGSALYVTGYDHQVQASNNLLVGATGQNAVYCDGNWDSQPPQFSNSNAFSVGGTGFDGTCAGVAGINGNISADPLFVNAASDFHLQSASPAIDAGSNSAPNLPQTDYDAKSRIIDGNNDCVSTVDMGAYELQRAANVSFSTNSLSFGNQVIGTSSSAQQVTLTNTGNTCFQLSNLQITGDFSQGNNCAVAGVPGGSACNYYVTFSPTAIGPRLGALTVGGSDGVSTSNLNLNLSGYGLTAQPSLSLSPAGLSFGAQLVGTSSAAQTITLTSTGNTALVLSGITVSGPFVQTNSCPSSLAPTATCTISISFRPTAGGTQSGLLSITDNASGSPHTANLSGTGIDFSIAASPTSASVKHGQSVNFTITVSPVGGAFSSSVVLSCSGLPSGALCSFSPSSVTPGEHGTTSVMTISTLGKTPRGNYNILIAGKSGSDSHSITVLLSVN